MHEKLELMQNVKRCLTRTSEAFLHSAGTKKVKNNPIIVLSVQTRHVTLQIFSLALYWQKSNIHKTVTKQHLWATPSFFWLCPRDCSDKANFSTVSPRTNFMYRGTSLQRTPTSWKFTLNAKTLLFTWLPLCIILCHLTRWYISCNWNWFLTKTC